jgi:hypothetical protein
MNIPRRGKRIFCAGLRLALIALAVQAAIPFLLAFELRAFAQSPEAALLDAPLCLHAGTSAPASPAPHQECTPAACPLCAALSVASLLGPPAASAGLTLPTATTLSIGRVAAVLPSRSFSVFSYRSRAPPIA